MAELRIPPGASLLLIGSGLYWILSSQLISSFTVLTPGLFQADELGASLITIVGVVSATVGLWIVKVDFDELRRLFSRSDAWVFTVPLALVAGDVYLTLIVLSTNSQIVELNPFVSSAIGIGAAALIPFIVSYLGTITRTRSVHAPGRLISFRSSEILQVSSIRLNLRSSRFWTSQQPSLVS